MIRMEVRGANEQMARFEKIKADMYKGFAAALLAGAFPVSNDAKNTAPYLSGNLRRSIHVGTKTKDITKPQPDSDGATIRQMPADMSAVKSVATSLQRTSKADILVGTDVEYAAVQEFLHHPYLRPALDNNKAEVRDEVKRAVKMVIAKAEAAAL